MSSIISNLYTPVPGLRYNDSIDLLFVGERTTHDVCFNGNRTGNCNHLLLQRY